MARLKNHSNLWLNDAAAASIDRYEDDHGVQPITSAGRTEAEQQALINRWDQGGTYNRPPYLYNPMRPARNGAHVKNGGNAIDLSNWREFLKHCDAYGWVQTYSWDVVHFEYFASRDKHRTRPSGGGNSSKPEPTPELTKEDEDEEMAMKGAQYDTAAGTKVFILFNDNSGFYSEHSGVDGGYNNALATGTAWDTGNWPSITEGHAKVLKSNLDKVRRGL